jgi:hypothetical protein
MTTGTARTAAQLQGQLRDILNLVESDQYASAFQSLGQYRKALAEFIQEVTKNE